MKYILVLGILYKKYKEETANVKIYAGGRFVDEFDLTKDLDVCPNVLPSIEQRHFKQFSATQHFTQDKDKKLWENSLPKFYKVFEIDDAFLNDTLKIRVDNSWSDYTNGFMKNSAMIQFPVIALFPKSIIENDGEKLIKMLIRYDDLRKKSRVAGRLQGPDQGYGLSWPAVSEINVDFEFDQHNKPGLYFINHWLGSNFDVSIDIINKHGMKMLHSAGTPRRGVWNCNFNRCAILGSMKQLLNIYNEDQRSNIT